METIIFEGKEAPAAYLGDGVYAIYDGYGVWLHANDHRSPTDRIYLEPEVLGGLTKFFVENASATIASQKEGGEGEMVDWAGVCGPSGDEETDDMGLTPEQRCSNPRCESWGCAKHDTAPCATCGGTGMIGYVENSDGFYLYAEEPVVRYEPCEDCGGTGEGGE